ncbi:hypothetical protein BDV10DRAFT_159650 [Aspergillus recurvatus]
MTGSRNASSSAPRTVTIGTSLRSSLSLDRSGIWLMLRTAGVGFTVGMMGIRSGVRWWGSCMFEMGRIPLGKGPGA